MLCFDNCKFWVHCSEVCIIQFAFSYNQVLALLFCQEQYILIKCTILFLMQVYVSVIWVMNVQTYSVPY